MKKLLITLLSFFLCGIISAQYLPVNPTAYGSNNLRGEFQKAILLPTICGTPTFMSAYSVDSTKSAYIMDSCNNKVYYYNPKTHSWYEFGSTMGTISNSDSLQHIIGTSYLKNYDSLFNNGFLSRTHGKWMIDSLGGLVLKYSDTSNMLDNKTFFLGTTQLQLNRISGTIGLTGVSIDGTSGSASNVVVNNDITTNSDFYPIWVNTQSGNAPVTVTSNSYRFNPSTGNLYATKFTGSGLGLTGIVNSINANSGLSASTSGGVTTLTNTGVLSVSGISNRITSSGGQNPAIDISSSYIGQSSITTVGTLTSGAIGTGFTAIPNSALANSTISGIQLGTSLSDLTVGNGLQLNSATTYNGSVGKIISADTTIVSSKNNVIVLVSGKLNISDTSAMLSPYPHFQAVVKYYDTTSMLSNHLKISDTANMLSGYSKSGQSVKYSDTSSMLSNRLKISDTAIMLSGYTRLTRFSDSLTAIRGRIDGGGTLVTEAQPNITSVGILTNLTAVGIAQSGTWRALPATNYYSDYSYQTSRTTPSTETSDDWSFTINGGSAATTGNGFEWKTQTGNAAPTRVFYIAKDGTATHNGSITASSIIKSGGAPTDALMGNGSTQVVTSNAYTPTLTNTTNITSSTLYQATYIRVGNIVTVSIGASVTPTLGASTVLTFTLPFTTSNGTQTAVGGAGIIGNSGSYYATGIVNIVSTTTATVTYISAVAGSSNVGFTFQYAL